MTQLLYHVIYFFFISEYLTVNNLSRFYVFTSNGRHSETHLLSSHRVQNNRTVFFSHVFFFALTAAAFTIEFECHAFSAGVVWLSTDRELCWIPFLSSCFNQCELAPLSYFMRGDFCASPLCRWFWLPLPSLVFETWILVLTRELTLLPSFSPGCLPDCCSRVDILGHMLIQITFSEREDAATGVFRMMLHDTNITPGWKPHWPVTLFPWEWFYILPLSHIWSLFAVMLAVNIHTRWQGSNVFIQIWELQVGAKPQWNHVLSFTWFAP